MIEFIDKRITENVTQSIVITYPRKVCMATGIYPVVEDIHNLMMSVKKLRIEPITPGQQPGLYHA